MEIALYVMFTAFIGGGMYLCLSRCMSNFYSWKITAEDLHAKKCFQKNWISFLVIGVLWLLLYGLSVAFISKYISVAIVLLLLTIVDALGLKAKKQDIKKDMLVNKLCLGANILFSVALLIIYLVWIF
ncbi:MAG: hypothetical protein RR348_03540 [Clostridia bacterium]